MANITVEMMKQAYSINMVPFNLWLPMQQMYMEQLIKYSTCNFAHEDP